MIDVSRRSIEETAAAIVALQGKKPVALPSDRQVRVFEWPKE